MIVDIKENIDVCAKHVVKKVYYRVTYLTNLHDFLCKVKPGLIAELSNVGKDTRRPPFNELKIAVISSCYEKM